MQRDIDRVLIDRHAIARRIAELAADITRDLGHPAHNPALSPDSDPHTDALHHTWPDDGEITIIPVLTGSIIFVADLIRKMPLRLSIHLTSVRSYPGKATTSKGAMIQKELSTLPETLEGRDVLVVDDILDSGNTLRLVTDLVGQKNPRSLRTCVLLRKQRPEAMAFDIDYVAFDIPDEFVAGYGLDFDGYYRNLPDIVTLKREVIGEA